MIIIQIIFCKGFFKNTGQGRFAEVLSDREKDKIRRTI
jgi:hypothetical protein